MKKFCGGFMALVVALLLTGCAKVTKQQEQESVAEKQARMAQEKADAAERQRLQREQETAEWVTARKAAKEKKEKEDQEWLAAYEKERAAKKAKVEAERKEQAKKTVTETMKELPTKTEGHALVIQPGTPERGDEKARIERALKAERHYTVVKPPYPPVSQPFQAEPFQGTPALDIHQVAPTKDGGIAVAARDGGYLIAKDGKVKVVGRGKDCTAVTTSPVGDIAFAFAFTKERKVTIYWSHLEPHTFDDSRTVVEVHILGAKPRSILLGQDWRQCNEGVSSLAYSPDGKTLAILSYPNGLTLVTGEKVWRHPDRGLYTNRLGEVLGFHPTNSSEVLCSGQHLTIGKKGACERRYAGGSASFGPEGQMVSVQMDWEDLFHEIHDGNRAARAAQMRFRGPDRIAVSNDHVAYTMLDTVLIWDRQSQKVVRTFRNVPDTEWTWMPGYVQSLAFRGPNLIVASSNGEVAEWEVTKGRKLKVVVPVRPVVEKKK